MTPKLWRGLELLKFARSNIQLAPRLIQKTIRIHHVPAVGPSNWAQTHARFLSDLTPTTPTKIKGGRSRKPPISITTDTTPPERKLGRPRKSPIPITSDTTPPKRGKPRKTPISITPDTTPPKSQGGRSRKSTTITTPDIISAEISNEVHPDVVEADVAQASSIPPAIILRPYQESAIDACLSAIAAGKTRIGVSSPTGSGKTTMFMNLIPRFSVLKSKTRRKDSAEDEKGSVLIVVSSVELAAQAEGAAKRLLGPDWSVEVEQSKRSASGIADVCVLNRVLKACSS